MAARYLITSVFTLASVSLASCTGSDGEKLARTYCAACHMFPDPQLLDKKTWELGVLPQMARRVGVHTSSSFEEALRHPNVQVLPHEMPERDWRAMVSYYVSHAPDSLPYQVLPAEPQLDPAAFKPGPFVPRLRSSGIITLLKQDSASRRIFVGEAGTNLLRIFDWNRRLRATLPLPSPPTDVIVEQGRLLVLESGILDPNDEPAGSLVQFDVVRGDSLRFGRVVLDSLIRPVFVQPFDFDHDGRNEFVVCEFGDNIGRLALYRYNGTKYERHVLAATPGAIRFEIRDLTGDGQPDIIALFAQGDERIVLFENDGKGNFAQERVLARFPPVYGSMYFTMRDFNGDGKLDILYVNGDNFDFSRILKPYHGIRILANDGHNNFHERYFFPVYGAARAEVADFNNDGRLDIVTTSNFADLQRHPERGIMYLENIGPYQFKPYAFTIASDNEWNLMTAVDLHRDGFPDVLIGAMHLASVAHVQRQFAGQPIDTTRAPVLLLENRMRGKSNSETR